MSKTELLLAALIEAQNPQLVGHITVSIDLSSELLYEARRCPRSIAIGLSLLTLKHPHRMDILHRAAMSALEIKRGLTTAVRVAEA